MLVAIGDVLTAFIGWIGAVINALVTAPGDGVAGGALYALLPLFCIGIGVSTFMVAFKAVRKITWGA